MPKVKGFIVGRNLNHIVIDGRTLNGMEKAGHFNRVSKYHPYVDEGNKPRTFTWKEQRYRIEYFDGCFYAFVVKQVQV
jgi:hypothetical protein